MIRLLKFHQLLAPVYSHPNQVGRSLTHFIDRRVVMMLAGLIISIPLLSPDYYVPSISQSMGLSMIDGKMMENEGLRERVIFKYIEYTPNILYLRAYGRVYIDLISSNTGLRNYEIETYSATNSYMQLSTRSIVYTESGYNLLIHLLLIFLFLLSSVLISRDIHILVVAPLERMTLLIKKLAGTLCFLSNTDSDIEIEQYEGELETNMIEAIIDRLATIFSVKPDASAVITHTRTYALSLTTVHFLLYFLF